MKPDAFEEKLLRQTPRQIPAEWRQGILRAAQLAGPRSSTLDSRPAPWWREWFWPCPQAWAGLAVVWVVILALNCGANGPQNKPSRQTAAVPKESTMTLAERRELLNELLANDGRLGPLAEPTKPAVPRPQSRRRSTYALV